MGHQLIPGGAHLVGKTFVWGTILWMVIKAFKYRYPLARAKTIVDYPLPMGTMMLVITTHAGDLFIVIITLPVPMNDPCGKKVGHQ